MMILMIWPNHFYKVITATKEKNPNTTIEVLTIVIFYERETHIKKL